MSHLRLFRGHAARGMALAARREAVALAASLLAAVLLAAGALVAISLAGSAGCGAGEGSGPSLQSSCVHENIDLPRTVADGSICYNMGYLDCGTGKLASKCVNYCAFDVCQAAQCTDDATCATAFGSRYECQYYTVDGISHGRWCGISRCPRASVGCPCGEGGQCMAPDSYWQVSCNASNICEGTDTCPRGCRSGSVCCGGALCSGDCIGTPCC